MTKITKVSKAKELKQKFYERKLELMKELAFDKELHTSDKGNIYVYLNDKIIKEFTFNQHNVTKSTIHKLCTFSHYPDSKHRLILLMKPNGGMLLKNSNKWKSFTPKVAFNLGQARSERNPGDSEKLVEIALLGRKCEWLKSSTYKELRSLSLAHQFTSFREFKKYFGYEFLSDEVFLHFFDQPEATKLIFATINESQDFKAKLANHFRVNCASNAELIKDTLKMAYELGQNVSLPRGAAALKEAHDALVDIQNKSKAEKYPTNEIGVVTNLVELMAVKGYKVEMLNSPRALFLKGSAQRHCLASYGRALGSYLFVSISKEGETETYEAQIHIAGTHVSTISENLSNYIPKFRTILEVKGLNSEAKINQYSGFKNCAAPDKFKEDLRETLRDIEFYLMLIKPTDFKYENNWSTISGGGRISYPFDPFNLEVQNLNKDKLLNPHKYQPVPQIEERELVAVDDDWGPF